MKIEYIIKRVLRTYSYQISDACLETLASEIEAYFAVFKEKAWMYNDLCR